MSLYFFPLESGVNLPDFGREHGMKFNRSSRLVHFCSLGITAKAADPDCLNCRWFPWKTCICSSACVACGFRADEGTLLLYTSSCRDGKALKLLKQFSSRVARQSHDMVIGHTRIRPQRYGCCHDAMIGINLRKISRYAELFHPTPASLFVS